MRTNSRICAIGCEETEVEIMKHIKTIATGSLKDISGKGCGECQTSCQSACKTSCTVANQKCENERIKPAEVDA
jgi:predicted ribosomally synthesized six-cysteine peptide SCIFF